ncbi:MAG: hypothetical protein WDN31_05185 [Hyphomicrobium sp.]
MHSKESLDFIYKIAGRSSLLQWTLKHSEQRYWETTGKQLDLTRGWWTPPLAPADAYGLEGGQIERLGLTPIVSLSDHDDIEAPMSAAGDAAERENSCIGGVDRSVPRDFFPHRRA